MKTNFIKIRISDEDKLKIAAFAKKNNRTISDYVRLASLKNQTKITT